MEKSLKTSLLRKRERLTQRDIARRLGISQQYVSHLLTGRRKNPQKLNALHRLMKKEGVI